MGYVLLGRPFTSPDASYLVQNLMSISSGCARIYIMAVIVLYVRWGGWSSNWRTDDGEPTGVALPLPLRWSTSQAPVSKDRASRGLHRQALLDHFNVVHVCLLMYNQSATVPSCGFTVYQ